MPRSHSAAADCAFGVLGNIDIRMYSWTTMLTQPPNDKTSIKDILWKNGSLKVKNISSADRKQYCLSFDNPQPFSRGRLCIWRTCTHRYYDVFLPSFHKVGNDWMVVTVLNKWRIIFSSTDIPYFSTSFRISSREADSLFLMSFLYLLIERQRWRHGHCTSQSHIFENSLWFWRDHFAQATCQQQSSRFSGNMCICLSNHPKLDHWLSSDRKR